MSVWLLLALLSLGCQRLQPAVLRVCFFSSVGAHFLYFEALLSTYSVFSVFCNSPDLQYILANVSIAVPGLFLFILA